MRKFFVTAMFLSATICFLTSCRSEASVRRSVVVTLPPLKTLMDEIAGDSVEVTSLLNSSADPEQFEPSLSDLRRVSDADAYFAIGNFPTEEAMLDKLRGGSSSLDIRYLSEGIELLHGTHDHCDHHHAHDDAHHHAHGDADPHTWSSYRNMRVIASNMLEELCRLDPNNADYYHANHRRLEARLDSLDRAASEKLSTAVGTAFIVLHPSLSYFARDYGMHQIAIGAENKETSIVQAVEALEEAERHNASVIILDPGESSRKADNLQQHLNLPVIYFNPMAPDWEDQLQHLINEFSKAADKSL